MLSKEEFQSVAQNYVQHDNELKKLKDICDEEKSGIKDYMQSNDMDSCDIDGYVIKYSERTKTSTDKEKMLMVLKKDWISKYGDMECPYIKTREYVDMDELESVLYADELDKSVVEELNKCVTTTTVPTLTVKKKKKGE